MSENPGTGVAPAMDSSPTDATTPARVSSRGWVWWVSGGVLAAAGVGALLVGMIVAGSPPTVVLDSVASSGVKDLPHQVLPTTTPTPTLSPTLVRGERFVVPAVGLNVPVTTMDEMGGEITPPGFTSAYIVANMGVTLEHATQGTVFVVMHSVRGGGTGPGNALINVPTGTATVKPGDTITVGSATYTVTGARTELKTAVPNDSQLWANTPGRLVIITCMHLPSNTESTHNLITTTTRA